MRVPANIKAFAKRLPGIGLLHGGWPDDARFVVQAPVFAELLRRHPVAGTCLNAGAGEGLFVRFLNSFPALTRIVHLDLQKPDLAEPFQNDRNTAIAGSVVELPLADAEFDFVFCTEVLEHIENDTQALRELARVLRPGGVLLLSTPSPPAPHDPAHAREGYRLDELTVKLRAAGLEVIDYRFCFHWAMRALLPIWRWQYHATGQRRSVLPKAVVLSFGHFDRWLPIGRPWDIVVLARKIT